MHYLAFGDEKLKKTGKNSAILWLLSIAGFLAIFSTTISKNPVLSLFVAGLGGNASILGVIAAISPIAGILFSFPIGFMADKIGPKKLLVAAGLIFVTAPLLYLTITNPIWLIPIRFFHGIGTAILGPVAAMIIFRHYPKKKGERFGIYSSATLFGRTLAPIAGGAIISYFAIKGGLIQYKMVYVAALIAAIPVLILIMLLKEEKNSGEGRKLSFHDFQKALMDFVSERHLVGTSLAQMSAYFAFGAFETYLPILLSGRGFPAYQIGLIFSVQVLSIAISQPLFGRISDKIDRRIQIEAGLITLGIAIALVTSAPSIQMLIALSVLFGFGLSFATVATSAYVADVVPKERTGTSVGVLSAIMDVGHSSGPFFTGLMITAISIKAGFLLSLALCIAVAIIFGICTRGPAKWKK